MSKTVRKESDFYPTPVETIQNFMDVYAPNGFYGAILDPGAGSGNISKVVGEYSPDGYIVASELREEEETHLRTVAEEVYIGDFLKYNPGREFDYIIANPPFSLAKEFIEHCFEISPNSIKIFLLRTAFLESKARNEFWAMHPLDKLYVMSARPSFTNDGVTDATSYSWFIWDNTGKQEIHVIAYKDGILCF